MRGRLRMRGVRRSRRLEEEILSLARAMAKDWRLLIPACVSKCRECPVVWLEKKLMKINKQRDNEAKLRRLSSRGLQLLRGYAAMLLIAKQGKLPVLAGARLPEGDVAYAVRGKVRKDVLIGLQHFNNEVFRLYAYKEFAKKYGVCLVSTESGLYCTGVGSEVPREVVMEVLKRSGYKFKSHNSTFIAGEDEIGLRMRVFGYDIIISAKKARANVNMYGVFLARIAGKRVDDLFKIDVSCVDCVGDCGDCVGIDENSMERYKKRVISDKEFVEAQRRHFLRNFSGIIYGDKCYGRDVDRFIEDLAKSDREKKALRVIASSEQRLVVEQEVSANVIIKRYWEKYGRRILEELGISEYTDEIYSRLCSRKDVKNIFEEVDRHVERLKRLPPKLSKLPPYAQTVHDLVVAYRMDGEDGILAVARTEQTDMGTAAIIYSFLSALNNNSVDWKFSAEEKSAGKYLAAFAKSLLHCSNEDYLGLLLKYMRAAAFEKDAAILESMMRK